MVIDTYKLLSLKGSTAARTAKASAPEVGPVRLSKLLTLKGGAAAQSVKVGPPETGIEPDSLKLLVLKGDDAARSAKVGLVSEI